MLILDGVCHQLTSDGKARVADLEQRTPFTVVTNFVPRLCFDAPKAMVRSELAKFIDDAEPSHNFFTAVKITGRFKEVRVRTVTKQEKPYPPMSEAVSDDAEHVFNDVDGVIGGFRTPAYAKGIGVPGCHVHFINDDHSRGGHVLDYTVDEAVIELCPGTDMDLHLPVTAEFLGGRLSPEDLDEQLHTTEVKG